MKRHRYKTFNRAINPHVGARERSLTG